MLSYDDFCEQWWKYRPALAKTDMASNGQFDELTFIAYERYKKAMLSEGIGDDETEGAVNLSADAVPRQTITWSDTNLTKDFSAGDRDVYGTFSMLICTCGCTSFTILETDSYQTSGQCIECGKYYIVHSG